MGWTMCSLHCRKTREITPDAHCAPATELLEDASVHCSSNANLHPFVCILAFDAMTLAGLAKAFPDADRNSGQHYRISEAVLTFTLLQLMQYANASISCSVYAERRKKPTGAHKNIVRYQIHPL